MVYITVNHVCASSTWSTLQPTMCVLVALHGIHYRQPVCVNRTKSLEKVELKVHANTDRSTLKWQGLRAMDYM